MKSMLNKRQQLNAPRRKAIALAVAMCFVGEQTWANPNGAEKVRGTAVITSAGSTLTVENSPGAIINWHDFSIQVGETTIFNQVNAASAVLNRVTGGNISQILGTLKSNGQVYLINPSGITFGANAVIDVAGLVASTLNMTDADFIAGKKLFNADTANAGSVINHGEIKTPAGGFVYLLAPKVENNGIITTPSGEAILAAGNSVEIVDSVNPMQRVRVSAQSQDVNLSALMTQSNGNIFSVLNTGTVSANTVHQDATGRIFFKSAGSVQTTASSVIEAKGDTLNNGGTFIGFADTVGVYQGKIDARGKSGGFVETSGKYVIGLDSLDLKVSRLDVNGKGGTWLIDPYDITITATSDVSSTSSPSGSDIIFTPTDNGSQISALTVESFLDTGDNVIIDTAGGGTEDGNININASIEMSGSSDASLTFNADGQIAMGDNVSITDSGSGKLSVTMLSDRDGTGSTGDITASIIDVAGDVDLKANSGSFNFGFGATGQSQEIRGANVDLDIAGNVTILGGSGAGDLVGIRALNGNLKIKSGGAVDISGGSKLSSSATVSASGQVEIESNGLNLQGGGGVFSQAIIQGGGKVTVKSTGDVTLAGGSGDNSFAVIESTGGSGDVNIASSGNISLTGGSGANSNAIIESTGGDVSIEFTSSGRSLTLTGGTSATDGEAVIASSVGDVQIKGDIDAHNAILNFTGGSGAGLNDAGIVGNSISNLRVSSIGMLAGSGNDAFIATSNTTGVSPITINVTDGTTAGSVLLTGTAGNKAEIGSQTGNINVNINAGSLNLVATALNSVAGIGTDVGNASININATIGGLGMVGEDARIGSTAGVAQVNINATNTTFSGDGVSMSNGASIGSTGGSVTITGTSTSTTGRGININNGSSINSGNISLTGAGQGGQEGMFVSSATILATGTIDINANGLTLEGGAAANSASIISANGKVTVNSSGDVNLTGGSGVTSKAVIESINNDVEIEFSSQRNLTLTGGTSSGTTISTGGLAVIDALNGDVVIKGDIAANNPDIEINGGGSNGLNYAGITGSTISNFSTRDVVLLSGASNANTNVFGTTGGAAFIATINTTGIAPINVTSSNNITMISGGAEANIGSVTGNINANINASNFNIQGTNGIAGIGSGPGNANVNINASNGFFMTGSNARIGSFVGDAQITINATSNFADAILISDNATIGSNLGGQNISLTGASSVGRGVTITNSVITNGSGNGNISITGIGNGSGNTDGILINGSSGIVTGGGNITIAGTGSASGFSAAGVAIAGSTSISSGSGNIVINGTGQSSSGNSFGVVLFGSPSPTITSSSGNVVITGSSVIPTAVSLSSATITASSGNVTLAASNNNLSLDSAQINAGNQVNLIASNGNITQGPTGSIVTTKLNARALSIELLGSILNNSFNSALFDTASLVNVVNGANGTVNYEFAQNTQWLDSDDDASVLNVTANNGLTLDGSGSAGFDGDNTGTVNFKGSSLKLTNGMQASVDSFNIVANSIEMDQGSSIDANTLDISTGSLTLDDAEIFAQNNLRIVTDSLVEQNFSTILSNGTLDLVANNISMDNSSLSAPNLNILTKNLVMVASSIIGGNTNINSLPLAFKLAGDEASKQQVRTLFTRLAKNATINLKDSAIIATNVVNESVTDGFGNLNVVASDITLEGSLFLASNVATVFSANNITLTGGSDFSNGASLAAFGESYNIQLNNMQFGNAAIVANNEVLLVAGKQVILNSGASAARVEANSPNTLFMSFPNLASDGYVVDGVANAISNGKSGFFVNGAPAVLDTNFFVSYSGSLSQALLSFVTQNTTNNIINNTNIALKVDEDEKVEDKKESQQGECS